MKKQPKKSADVERVLAWRKKNPDKYRDYQRRYMRVRRAEGKE